MLAIAYSYIYRNWHHFNTVTINGLYEPGFVKENDEQWLHEIQPTLHALIIYLSRENNGIRVYEQKNRIDRGTGRQIYDMSNGLSYSHDEEGRWCVI